MSLPTRRTALFLTLACTTALIAQSADDAKREQQLKVADVIQALAIESGSQVADIGAGSGFFTSRLARKVGEHGRVYAVDIDDRNAIPELKKLVEKESLHNVDVIHSVPADPKLPAGKLDAVLMVIAYHEIEPYQEMLAHIKDALKPGGRLVVVDMWPHKTLTRPRADQTRNHVIDAALAEDEFRSAGFEIASRDDHFVDWPDEESTRWSIVCRNPK